jgi:hypothetical protein
VGRGRSGDQRLHDGRRDRRTATTGPGPTVERWRQGSSKESTWDTYSGSHSRRSAGPPRSSVPPRRRDRRIWLLVVAHTQLRLARPLAADLRRPWEKPAEPARLTPARLRRGFRTSALTCPARPVFPNPTAPVHHARHTPPAAAALTISSHVRVTSILIDIDHGNAPQVTPGAARTRQAPALGRALPAGDDHADHRRDPHRDHVPHPPRVRTTTSTRPDRQSRPVSTSTTRQSCSTGTG